MLSAIARSTRQRSHRPTSRVRDVPVQVSALAAEVWTSATRSVRHLSSGASSMSSPVASVLSVVVLGGDEARAACDRIFDDPAGWNDGSILVGPFGVREQAKVPAPNQNRICKSVDE